MAASVDGGDTGSGCRGDSNNKGHHIPLPSIVVTKKRGKKEPLFCAYRNAHRFFFVIHNTIFREDCFLWDRLSQSGKENY